MSDTTDPSKTKPTPDSQQDTDGADKGNQQTDSQKEQDRINAIVSERLKKEREKSEKELADRLKKEREDWERQAKLSAEEKEAEVRKRQEAEQAEREREITLRENRADARELLAEKNIPTTLVDFVVDVDADKTKANIDNLEQVYLKAVEQGVNDKLKGQTPTDKSTTTTAPTYTGTTVI